MFIFLDIEPAVNEDAATLFEIAYMTDSHLISNNYFKPDSINKTDRLKDSGFAKQLNELLQNPENIMAAHNAQSKVEILKQEGIEPKQFICTLKSARFMDRLGNFPKESLQYVRYRPDAAQDGTEFKDAFNNIFNVKRIFYRLYHRLFVDMFPDGQDKNNITKKVIELVNKSSAYPKPRFNDVFFDIAKNADLEKRVLQKMVEISKSSLVITPNLLWKPVE